MRILQINTVYRFGSTGRSVRDLHEFLTASGHESFVAAHNFYGEIDPKHFYQIETPFGQKLHSLESRITGLQAYGSRLATYQLCRYIDKIGPDVIHLQNIHSHFLNLPILLKFIARRSGRLTMTLHDCWFFTGRCVHYTSRGCDRYKTGCGECPKNYYGIKSWFFDRSAKMAADKERLFAGIKNLGLIAVSDWTLEAARQSFIFRNHPSLRSTRIYNWVNPEIFYPRNTQQIRNRLGIDPAGKVILGVSIYWTRAKGLPLFQRLAERLLPNEKILLVGNPPSAVLPPSVISVGLLSSESELADYYNTADIFVSGSSEETFGKSTAESLMCGTPVLCFNATSGPELVDRRWGRLVSVGDYDGVERGIREIFSIPKSDYAESARHFAFSSFNPQVNMQKHIEHYRSLF